MLPVAQRLQSILVVLDDHIATTIQRRAPTDEELEAEPKLALVQQYFSKTSKFETLRVTNRSDAVILAKNPPTIMETKLLQLYISAQGALSLYADGFNPIHHDVLMGYLGQQYHVPAELLNFIVHSESRFRPEVDYQLPYLTTMRKEAVKAADQLDGKVPKKEK